MNLRLLKYTIYRVICQRNFSYIFGYFLATLNISPKQNVVAYSLISNLSPLKRSAIVAVAFSSLDQEETSSSSFLTALTLFTGAEVALAVSNFLAFFFALFSFRFLISLFAYNFFNLFFFFCDKSLDGSVILLSSNLII